MDTVHECDRLTDRQTDRIARTKTVQRIASRGNKRYEIRPMLLLMTNRKLDMRFRMAPWSMTLDDLELDGGRPPFFHILKLS